MSLSSASPSTTPEPGLTSSYSIALTYKSVSGPINTTKSTSTPGSCLRYLSPEEHVLWDALVDESPQGNVFCRSWWLCALPGDVRVLAYFRGGHLIAGIPLYFERRLGVMLCRMPKLVHTWGVVMERLEGKRATVISREMEILTVFAEELANQRCFVQAFHPTLTNWLPFYWRDFRQQTRFGYVFEDVTSLDRIWEQMECNVRRNIRKARRKGLTIVPCASGVEAMVAEKTFKKQGKPMPYSEGYLNQLCSAAKAQSAGECFAAIDREGRAHAAAFVVWDRKRAYFLASGTDPELRASGAESLLTWHLLQFCADRTQTFDFAGSVVQRIETFERGFGASLVPYNRILKLPRPLQACCALMGIS
jgi:hypothetical protein